MNNLGLACRALLKHVTPGQPERLKSVSVRFAQPSYPGETIRIEWRADGDALRFRARSLERGVLVLDRGHCQLAAA